MRSFFGPSFAKIYFSKELFFCVILLAVEQAMVAFSTFSVAELAKNLFDGGGILLWLMVFFFCLVFVYIPSLFARTFLEGSKYISFKNYIELFKKRYFNCPMVINDDSFNETREPYLKSEGWHLTSSTIENLMGLWVYILSITLNTIIIAHETSSYMLLGYACSLLFSSVVIFLTKGGIKKCVDSEQSSRVRLSKSVMDALGNIILGNSVNYFSWYENFSKRFNSARACNKKMVVFRETMASISIVFAIMPIVIIILYTFFTSSDKKLLLVMLATLPRQIQITHYISDLVHSVIMFWDIAERNKGLLRSLEKYNFGNIKKKIDWNSIKITLDNEEIAKICSLKDFENAIKRMSRGRFLVKGKNGSGKTILLSMLKYKFGREAVFLPCDVTLCFHELNNMNLSSGEKAYNYLRLAAKQEDAKLYLFDEWDANLDKTKVIEASKMIDELARSRIVVEVRHRI